MTSQKNYTYIPGTCNLGPSEIRGRKFVALVGGLFSISIAIGFIVNDKSQSARLGLFVPLLVFAFGFIQSRKKFCLVYGLMGTYNLGNLKGISRVSNPKDRAADRKMALSIFGQAALLAAALTGAFLLLPF